jgi:predicted TPR repeat methyltransferase
LIEPYVQRLTGVDLSSQMLAKARGRSGYDELVKGELVGYLRAHEATYDLIVSADTLVYFGPLEDVLDAAKNALRGEGLLIFTIETVENELADGNGFRINPHGRYSHGRAYVERALQSAGFDVRAIEAVVLRTEGGSPVNGLVVTAWKSRDSCNCPP